MKCLQDFLKRLVQNESSIGDQVDDRKKQLELAAKLENEGLMVQQVEEEEAINQIEYEDEINLEDDDDALN